MGDPKNLNSAAPNNQNVLAAPEPRLPLGIKQQAPGGTTRFRVFIPARGGGMLAVHHEGASLRAFDDKGRLLGEAQHHVRVEIDKHAYGVHYVTSSGPVGDITATFTQYGWSRESAARDSKPLLPYNFWFYPYFKGAPTRAILKQAISKYATALNRNPAAQLAWEDQHHGRDADNGWEGHCHQSAPASAFFEVPESQTISAPGCGSANFDKEEMAVLATEYFGSYGRVKPVWSLPGIGGRGARMTSELLYMKPSAARTKKELLDSMTSSMAPSMATARAEEVIKSVGGEQNLGEEIRKAFALAASSFHRALLRHMLDDGQPLLSNLGPEAYNAAAGGVWNHMIFYFGIRFEETAGTHDERDITLRCLIGANADVVPPRSDDEWYPADPTSAVVVPSADPRRCRRQNFKWRLIFDGLGQPDGGDPRSDWQGAYAIPSFTEIYAPVNLDLISQYSKRANPRDQNLGLVGNEAVGSEIVDKGRLVIRSRFR